MPDTSIPFILSGLCFLLGIGLVAFAINRLSKCSLIQNTPRSKIRSMAMGLVEIQGNAVADKYVVAPFSQTQCLFYKYDIQEYRGHITKDANGHEEIKYSWERISSGEQRIPFFGKDETGQVYVDTRGAEFNVLVKKVFLQRAGFLGSFESIVNDLRNWDNNKAGLLSVSTWGLTPLDPQNQISFGAEVGDRKYFEYYIEAGENIFIMGTAANDPNVPDKVLIKKGQNEPTFIISDQSEKEVLGSLTVQMILSFVFGGLFVLAGIIFLANGIKIT